MPEISAKVVSTSAPNSGLGSSLSKINNVDWNFSTADYMLSRPADFFVYLFNIAKQEYKISRLPVIKEMVIPARKEGEKYARVTKLPSPMKMPKGNIDSNEIDIVIMDGRRMAMDIINPDNWTLDQDAVLTHSDSVGQNIGRLGVFWSLNEEPTEAELAAATRRLETHYRNLLTEARTTETSNPAALPAVITPAHHAAADYFSEQLNWHKKEIRLESCPRCGQPAKVGVPFHMLDGGGFCIDGVEGWKKAVASGVKSRAQAYDATDDEFFAPRVRKQTVPVEDEE